MASKNHICATWQLTKKHVQEQCLARGLAGFLMPCKKDPPTSWRKYLSSKAFGHVNFHTVLTDGCCPHGKPPVLTCNGLFRGSC
jgi:hypothetical protein